MTLKAGISVTENTTSARKTYTTLFYRPTLFFCAELEDRHFAHICNFRPPSGRTSNNINAICRPTSLESIFSGLQFCRRQYGYGSIIFHSFSGPLKVWGIRTRAKGRPTIDSW